MANVAENIVKTLHANGIDRVYGLPGDSLNGFTDALRKDGTIRWVHVRHEESAAFAAAADAATTGQLAVVAGSCGPGNLHLINGLYDANRSRVPVLAIAAHIPTNEIGTGYFQETHPQELFRECSVYVEYVADPRQMPRLLEIAMRAAIEKRGVAVLVIPGDVALADIADDRAVVIERTRPVVVPSGAELERAATLLNEAKSVTILAGAGVEGAHDEVIALADRLGAPIVHALRGKEFIEYDNPFDVGMTGLLGFASGYRAMESADALLVLGSDFPYEQFYPDGATTIQVDIRGEQLGKRHPLDLGLVGDVGATAEALLPRLAEKDRGHLDDATAHYRKTRAKLDDLAVPTKAGRPIHPQYLARLLNEQAADDAIFTADVGSPTVWAARYLRMTEQRRLIGSFTHGSMANALMHGIGAQVAHPDRQVVALAGDGGLAMMLGELLTLTQNRLPVKTIVVNNSSLNFVELEMKAAGFVTYGTGLDNPSFAAIAEAMGIFARRVERSEDLPDAVREVLAHDGPALLDVVTERQELSMPPAIEAAQVKGFALYAIRTVMSGRGDELLDLARANWRQLF
ncbi:Pyruvate dehydrogenase [ubiquinone] [Microbacterium oxydans]|uniref:Pyruvate dehydrogenase [ubiquinone] n=1 Tax=Microbacterium oxydans TaxID=82380 RepID=A0A0F0L9C2_9MICO|nr:ubiquinone-dependent pyruvate dehydrogenase [Microbacterium oxydans]KJL29723.1 Pyruvate dehydrogenase [ubiquinone] [Microbacterium oxydans]CAH0155111.1 Pyruvate dehydrogenase [ubiquinone] [Microbacterium oxydans]